MLEDIKNKNKDLDPNKKDPKDKDPNKKDPKERKNKNKDLDPNKKDPKEKKNKKNKKNKKDKDQKVSDPKVPDLKDPDVKDPDPKVSDLKVSDVKDPDLKVPDVKVPDVKDPDPKDPNPKNKNINIKKKVLYLMTRIHFHLIDHYDQITSQPDSLFIKCGTASSFSESQANTLYRVDSIPLAKKLFGNNSNLTNSLVLHFLEGGKELFAIRPENSLKGSLQSINKVSFLDHSNPIQSNLIQVLNKNFEDLLLWIRILEKNESQIKITHSIDQGKSWSNPILLEQKMSLYHLDLLFQDIQNKESYKENDLFIIKTTPDQYQLSDLEITLEKIILQKSLSYSIFHLVDPIGDPVVITKIDSFLQTSRQKKLWLRAILQLRNKNANESIPDYIHFTSQQFDNFYSEYLIFTFQYAFSKNMQKLMPVADYLLATLSLSKVHESPGWIQKFHQLDIQSISLYDDFHSLFSSLEEKGVTYLFYEDGLLNQKTPFFNIGRLKTQPHSEFRTISMGRSMDKALSLVHQAVIPFIGSNYISSSSKKASYLSLKTKIENTLDSMVREKEIISYHISLPHNGSSKELQINFRIQVNQHIEKMDFYVSFLY